MPRFRVYVTDTQQRSYFVEADTADEAKAEIEACNSPEDYTQYPTRLDDSYWAVEHVENLDDNDAQCEALIQEGHL